MTLKLYVYSRFDGRKQKTGFLKSFKWSHKIPNLGWQIVFAQNPGDSREEKRTKIGVVSDISKKDGSGTVGLLVEAELFTKELQHCLLQDSWEMVTLPSW